MRDGQWIEIGQQYQLPLDSSVLDWTSAAIPPSTLAVALKVYELDHPRSNLRNFLTQGLQSVRDYVTRKELGIRVNGRDSCCVIRMRNGEWTEIGQQYPLPLDRSLIEWTSSSIPPSTLAVALKVYELDHPESDLRTFLTKRPEPRMPQPAHHHNRFRKAPKTNTRRNASRRGTWNSVQRNIL
jgi:hypothetical protein